MKALRPVVEWTMRRALRRAFRAVYWTGPEPDLPSDTPLVVYANHHTFYDGYLLWLINDQLLGRPSLTWMEDWDRFPIFGAIGALPFPRDDASQRAATIRQTARLFRTRPEHVLVYFPEGVLHPPDEGILPFDAPFLSRLGRLLPDARWWPIAIHTTWRGHDQPVAILRGGEPHHAVPGDAYERLMTTWQEARTPNLTGARIVLRGRRSPHERWNLAFLRRFFRYTA